MSKIDDCQDQNDSAKLQLHKETVRRLVESETSSSLRADVTTTKIPSESPTCCCDTGCRS